MKAEEAESSDGEDPESGVGGADQVVGYIIHLPMWSSCIRGKTEIVLGCGSPDHLVKDFPKDLSKTTQKVSLNMKGDDKEGRLEPSETSSHSTGLPG